MSCGKPHATDCSEVLERLAFFIDHELETADEAQIQEHIEECLPCLRVLQFEQRMKARLVSSCSEPCPDGLKERVLLRIREVHVRISQTP